MAKDFKKNVNEMFISSIQTTQEQPNKTNEMQNVIIPKGFKLSPVNKSARLNLLLKPNTKDDIKRIATSKGLSTNELINIILEDYIERSTT